MIPLLVTLAAAAHTREVTKGNVTVLVFPEGGECAVAVNISNKVDADQAIVTVFYWQGVDWMHQKLLRSKSGTVDTRGIHGMNIMAVTMPATEDQIHWIDVQLVQHVGEKTRFDMDGTVEK